MMYYLSRRYQMYEFLLIICSIDKVYLSLRNKFIWGVFLIFFTKSYIKLFLNADFDVSDDRKT